jgi:hypothetical protein
MEFGVIRRDSEQGVLVSTHPDFCTALAQRDKLGPGHEVRVLGATALPRVAGGNKRRQKAARQGAG